jgi:2-oxoglutarate dehydrogenase complex dehydrogenase (E1) component-like enzyme
MTPKYLLRAPAARSAANEFTSGHFRETLDDPSLTDPKKATSVVLCSGKIAYQLIDARNEHGKPAAVVRVEQLYPFPAEQLRDILGRYPQATEVIWVQEEPENMGAWRFIQDQLAPLLPAGAPPTGITRFESGSPATGSAKIHEQEQQELIRKALGL